MPIEVRELVIKVAVGQEGQSGAGDSSGSNPEQTSSNEDMINTCVEKVLQILKERNER